MPDIYFIYRDTLSPYLVGGALQQFHIAILYSNLDDWGL